MSILSLVIAISLMPLVLARPFNDGGINLGRQKGFFEGDLVMPTPKNRNAVFKTKRWTDGIVPWLIEPESIKEYTPEDIKLIDDTMRAIEKHTCLRFVPYTNQPNYLKIKAGSSCSSTNVGMTTGVNWVSLDPSQCMVHRIVIHEIFHAIGLYHEHSRYDRDQYLTVHYDRLAPPPPGMMSSAEFNLRIANESESTFYGIPYNYASVMHYDAWSLGDQSAGYFIMEPKNLFYLSIMGYASTANETDYEKVRRLYDCKGKYPVQPPAKIECIDEDVYRDCNETFDYCDKDSTTIYNCRKTCGYCEWAKPPVSNKQRPCRDWRPDCASYMNDCKRDSWRRKCAVTCGVCKAGGMEIVTPKPNPTAGPTPKPTSKKPPSKPGCEDTVGYCADYKQFCGQYGYEWMNNACRETCGC